MKKHLYPIWGFLYALCAFLGAVQERSSGGQVVMTILSVLFFVPGFWLLALALKHQNKKELKTLRLISGICLGLTLLALIGNILSVFGSVALGNVMHMVLILVSVPMMCGKIWVFSLFLWAVLFIATFPRMWKKVL